MSFSKRILIGLAAGILVGLFLGDRASALKWAADGFVKLLQMTVLPYLTVSIVGSLGRLQYDQARRLGVRTGLVIAGLWAVALIFTFLIPLAFPQVESASFFSSSLVEHQLQCNPQLGRQTVGELDVVPNQLSTAFVMRDSARDRFTSWEDVRTMPAVTPAVPDVPYYIEKLEQLAPRASIQTITSISATLESFPPGVDAVAFPAERGSAWTLIFPAYSVVVPEPGIVKIPLAYPIGRHDQAFATFVNTWIDLKRKDGTLDAAYRYWILGQNSSARPARWSIIRDVLHWVE